MYSMYPNIFFVRLLRFGGVRYTSIYIYICQVLYEGMCVCVSVFPYFYISLRRLCPVLAFGFGAVRTAVSESVPPLYWLL